MMLWSQHDFTVSTISRTIYMGTVLPSPVEDLRHTLRRGTNPLDDWDSDEDWPGRPWGPGVELRCLVHIYIYIWCMYIHVLMMMIIGVYIWCIYDVYLVYIWCRYMVYIYIYSVSMWCIYIVYLWYMIWLYFPEYIPNDD